MGNESNSNAGQPEGPLGPWQGRSSDRVATGAGPGPHAVSGTLDRHFTQRESAPISHRASRRTTERLPRGSSGDPRRVPECRSETTGSFRRQTLPPVLDRQVLPQPSLLETAQLAVARGATTPTVRWPTGSVISTCKRTFSKWRFGFPPMDFRRCSGRSRSSRRPRFGFSTGTSFGGLTTLDMLPDWSGSRRRSSERNGRWRSRLQCSTWQRRGEPTEGLKGYSPSAPTSCRRSMRAWAFIASVRSVARPHGTVDPENWTTSRTPLWGVATVVVQGGCE